MLPIKYKSYLLIIILFFLGINNVIRAQEMGDLKGKVENLSNKEGLPGANIRIKQTNIGTTTDASGKYHISDIPEGEYQLMISYVGYRNVQKQIQINGGKTTEINISLVSESQEIEGVEVRALRPNLSPESSIDFQLIQENNMRDAGELLRNVDGVDAVRRGPVGLDPVIRGLRETEVGVYIDGARMFPAGPARMDSPLSHIPIDNIQSLEVVKGPYALTWGAGNLGATKLKQGNYPRVQRLDLFRVKLVENMGPISNQ